MIDFYSAIKFVHVAAVVVSGTMFLLRGTASLAGAPWPKLRPVRYLSYVVDTTLLLAALLLVAILPAVTFANGWLYLKLLLLPVYIVLGMLALGRGKTAPTRWFGFFAALCVYGAMVGIARTHSPWGWLAPALR